MLKIACPISETHKMDALRFAARGKTTACSALPNVKEILYSYFEISFVHTLYLKFASFQVNKHQQVESRLAPLRVTSMTTHRIALVCTIPSVQLPYTMT